MGINQECDALQSMLRQVIDSLAEAQSRAKYLPDCDIYELKREISDIMEICCEEMSHLKASQNQIELIQVMIGNQSGGYSEARSPLLPTTTLATNLIDDVSNLATNVTHNPNHPNPSPSNNPASSPSTQSNQNEQIAKATAENLELQDGGHSLARHGPDRLNIDLENRLTTGIAPNGVFSPTQASTRFNSYQDWLETRQAALNAIAKREGIDLSQPPPVGKQGSFNIILEHGKPIDDGFVGSGTKVKITDPVSGKQGKVYTNAQSVKGLTRTQTQLEWNSSTNRWEVKQHYPDARNWDQLTASYTAPP